MSDQSRQRLTAIAMVAMLAGIGFSGGAVTYGVVSDTETATGTFAAAEFDQSAENTATTDTAGNDGSCVGNTECDGSVAIRTAPTVLSAATVATRSPMEA